MSLRIIFAGTAEFAIPSLQALIASSHQIIAVYTQPDRPAGRGQRLQASMIKTIAVEAKLPILQPMTLKSAEALPTLQALAADIMVVVAYGLLIPSAILKILPLGAINVHASLLPRWRGAAPIQHAIWAGDEKTGVSIMQLERGLDTGPVFMQHECFISQTMTSHNLQQQLATMGAAALLETLTSLEQGQAHPEPQQAASATYAHKIYKEHGVINWQLPATDLHNQIRALNPWPIAFTLYRGQPLRIWQSEVVPKPSIYHTAPLIPGTIAACNTHGIEVATGSNESLRLLTVQLPGGKPIRASDFINAQRPYLQPGKTQLGTNSPY